MTNTPLRHHLGNLADTVSRRTGDNLLRHQFRHRYVWQVARMRSEPIRQVALGNDALDRMTVVAYEHRANPLSPETLSDDES